GTADSSPARGPPSSANTVPATHSVIAICAALNAARIHGLRCTRSSASRLLTAVIHIAGSRPHRITVARLAAEAIERVPAPDSVWSHRVSPNTHTPTQAR